MATNILKLTQNVFSGQVGEALTTSKKKVKIWQYGSELTTEWKVGGKINFKNK